MGWAGAGVPSPNRITLLRDADGDGVAETQSTFLTGLNSPFGMALVGDSLYVANTDAVLRFPYREGDTTITAPGTKVADLPAGAYNYHWTKSIVASRDGSKLFVGGGIEQQCRRERHGRRDGPRRHRRDRSGDGDTSHPFATGLRNPVGLAFEPESGALWVAVNERDELGSDLVPDYMTAGQGRRLLRLALQLLRGPSRSARAAAAPRSRRQSNRARLCARPAHRLARAGLLRRHAAARALSRRRLRRPARLVEPRSAERLQGDLRAVLGGHASGPPEDVLPAFAARTAMRSGGPSASRSTRLARCSSPTMSAI